jgi:hypothetical protein
MFNFSVFCFDEVDWFVSVYLELLPSGLIGDEL